MFSNSAGSEDMKNNDSDSDAGFTKPAPKKQKTVAKEAKAPAKKPAPKPAPKKKSKGISDSESDGFEDLNDDSIDLPPPPPRTERPSLGFELAQASSLLLMSSIKEAYSRISMLVKSSPTKVPACKA